MKERIRLDGMIQNICKIHFKNLVMLHVIMMLVNTVWKHEYSTKLEKFLLSVVENCLRYFH